MDFDNILTADLVSLQPKLAVRARRLTRNRDDAEDLVQETLARAWAKRDSFQPGTSLAAWTYKILHNCFLMGKRRTWRDVSLTPILEEALAEEPAQEAVIELDEMRQALSALGDQKRMALLLIAVGGLSYQELADAGVSALGTVKSRVSRGRAELRGAISSGAYARDGVRPHQAHAMLLAEGVRLSRLALAGVAPMATVE